MKSHKVLLVITIFSALVFVLILINKILSGTSLANPEPQNTDISTSASDKEFEGIYSYDGNLLITKKEIETAYMKRYGSNLKMSDYSFTQVDVKYTPNKARILALINVTSLPQGISRLEVFTKKSPDGVLINHFFVENKEEIYWSPNGTYVSTVTKDGNDMYTVESDTGYVHLHDWGTKLEHKTGSDYEIGLFIKGSCALADLSIKRWVSENQLEVSYNPRYAVREDEYFIPPCDSINDPNGKAGIAIVTIK